MRTKKRRNLFINNWIGVFVFGWPILIKIFRVVGGYNWHEILVLSRVWNLMRRIKKYNHTMANVFQGFWRVIGLSWNLRSLTALSAIQLGVERLFRSILLSFSSSVMRRKLSAYFTDIYTRFGEWQMAEIRKHNKILMRWKRCLLYWFARSNASLLYFSALASRNSKINFSALTFFHFFGILTHHRFQS